MLFKKSLKIIKLLSKVKISKLFIMESKTENKKICRVCNLEGEFEKNRRKCRKCMQKIRYELNKKNNYYNNYYHEHKDIVLKCQREYYLRKKEKLKNASNIEASDNNKA